MSKAWEWTDKLKIVAGDSVLVVHEDGSYHAYVDDGPQTIGNMSTMGLAFLLDDYDFHKKLLARTAKRIKELKAQAKAEEEAKPKRPDTYTYTPDATSPPVSDAADDQREDAPVAVDGVLDASLETDND